MLKYETKTPLQKIQEAIDACNKNNGCSAICSIGTREKCKLLKAHKDRIKFCSENNINIKFW